MNIKLIVTGDGSHSLFREDLDETYHSTHGAETESRHVFIEHGLKLFTDWKEPIRILEIGFGTGLNALLTLEYSLEKRLPIEYHTLEPFPLEEKIYSQLNFHEAIRFEQSKEYFLKMHSGEEFKSEQLTERFSFQKYYQKLEDFKSEEQFDLIYFDAFAPSKQVGMWSEEVIEHVGSLTKRGGVLTTYCAQGQFKRNLKAAGFEVEALPGPPNKFQMTRGRKKH